MNIKTEDLLVRNFRAGDLDSLHAIYSDARVMEYMGGPCEDREETRDELESAGLGASPIRYAVVESRSGRFLGEVTYVLHDEDDMKNEAEIGWVLDSACWNRGYAQQLTAALIAQAEKDGAVAVFLCCEEDQEIPAHIAEKFGFEYVGLEWGQSMYRKVL